MPDNSVQHYLAEDDADLARRWEALVAWMQERFGRESVGIEAILFLIGIQEHGRGYEPKLRKQAKQDLIMEGTFHAFERLGFYERVGMEEDGAWIWERTVRLPELDVDEQEKLLRLAILRYFDSLLTENLT